MLQIPDIINAGFESGGCLFILNNCHTLYQHKMVRGVSILSTSFFGLWGIWNVFYYNHLEQTFSWYAGLCIMIANALWIAMMLYYHKKEKKLSSKSYLNKQITP